MAKEKLTIDQVVHQRKRDPKKSGLESFPGAKSKVDTLGYMPLADRVLQFQIAGQNLKHAKAAMYDGENDSYESVPFRGQQPDLADISEMQREKYARVKELKQAHKIRKEQVDKELKEKREKQRKDNLVEHGAGEAGDIPEGDESEA